MSKVNKNNEYVRKAIFEVYGKKCFYTGDPLDYVDMQLDHIIPESIKSDKRRLNDLLNRCGLSEDFEINSLYNLVPTNRYENRRKSDLEYNDNALIHYLQIISRNVYKIENEIDRLKKKSFYEDNLSSIKAQFDENKSSNERGRAIEELVDFINNEETEFTECEHIYDFKEQQVFKKYTKRIGIEAILPKYNNVETQCVLYFKTLKIRDCKIILENEIILKELFSGIFTNPLHGIRGFIEFEEEKNYDLTLKDFDKALIRVGSNRLKFNYEDICLLCEAIDSYAKTYITRIKEIENTLKTLRFPLSKRRSTYKFISITQEQWNNIVKFVKRHDVDRGNSPWHIFDSTQSSSTLAIYTNKSHPKYEVGFHSFFNIEKDEDSVFHPSIASNKLIIAWSFFREDIDKKDMRYLNERENWDAEYAYNWFTKELMPKVGIKLKKKNIFNKYQLELEEMFENNKIEFISYIEANKIITKNDLLKCIELLQEHFHVRPKNRYRLSGDEFKYLYSSIVVLIKKSKIVDIFYLCDKLYLKKCNDVNELLLELKILIDTANECKTIGFKIDTILRAYRSLLSERDLNLERSIITDITTKLNFLIDIYNRETLIDKYSITYLVW